VSLPAKKHNGPSPSYKGRPLALPSERGEKRPCQMLKNFFQKKKEDLLLFFINKSSQNQPLFKIITPCFSVFYEDLGWKNPQ
jgi:hypothetical protein